MARVYRQVKDSRGFTRPRILARVFVEPGRLEETVRFYEQLTGVSLDMEIDASEQGLHLVAVGSFLLLDLDPKLDRYEQARATPVTMIFADLDVAIEQALRLGAERSDRFAAPTGSGARLRHPDGLLVEYLEHRPGPDDVD